MSCPQNVMFKKMQKLVADFSEAMVDEGYPIYEGHLEAERDEGMAVFVVGSFEVLLNDKNPTPEKLEWLKKFRDAVAECYIAEFGGTYVKDYTEEFGGSNTANAIRIITEREDLIAAGNRIGDSDLTRFANEAFAVMECVYIPQLDNNRPQTLQKLDNVFTDLALHITNANKGTIEPLVKVAEELLVTCCDKNAKAHLKPEEIKPFRKRVSDVRQSLGNARKLAPQASVLEAEIAERHENLELRSVQAEREGLKPDILAFQRFDPNAVADGGVFVGKGVKGMHALN